MKLSLYDELPLGSDGVPTAWGLFGVDDSIGRINLITNDVVTDAARLVRRGVTFALDVALDFFNPPLDDSRGLARHRVLRDGAQDVEGLDDVLDNYFPQIASQWDSLAHVAASPGVFYNNRTVEDVTTGGFNTIDHVARCGIVTRAVLLDLPVVCSEEPDARDFTHGSVAITVEDLERVRQAAGISYSPGCALVIRTGFLSWYYQQSAAARSKLSENLHAPGLDHSEDMARYLWNSGASAVVSDSFATEVWPPDWSKEAEPYGYLHRVLIGRLGFSIGELWDLEALSEDSSADGVYEFLLASAPLNIPGGIGSPANAVGIK
jgi:kynurenine formamidase